MLHESSLQICEGRTDRLGDRSVQLGFNPLSIWEHRFENWTKTKKNNKQCHSQRSYISFGTKKRNKKDVAKKRLAHKYTAKKVNHIK